jgi:hypothetical protein
MEREDGKAALNAFIDVLNYHLGFSYIAESYNK